MKEIACTARNLMVVSTEESYSPMIEVILVLTEPNYRFNKKGELVKRRDPETIRFSTSPDGLREIAKNFNQWANDAEEILKPKDTK